MLTPNLIIWGKYGLQNGGFGEEWSSLLLPPVLGKNEPHLSCYNVIAGVHLSPASDVKRPELFNGPKMNHQ